MTMVEAALVEPLSVAVHTVRIAETGAGGAVGDALAGGGVRRGEAASVRTRLGWGP